MINYPNSSIVCFFSPNSLSPLLTLCTTSANLYFSFFQYFGLFTLSSTMFPQVHIPHLSFLQTTCLLDRGIIKNSSPGPCGVLLINRDKYSTYRELGFPPPLPNGTTCVLDSPSPPVFLSCVNYRGNLLTP